MQKVFYRSIKLSNEAKYAKLLLLKLCRVLSDVGGREFCLEMNLSNDFYEGHIVDTGRCSCGSADVDEWHYDPDGPDEIGMIFFGGHFSRKKHKDAISKAWISLLEDCIGIGELKEHHALTRNLETFGPRLDVNFKSFREFEVWANGKFVSANNTFKVEKESAKTNDLWG